MRGVFYKANITLTIILAITLSGCVLDDVIRVGESGSKSYETVKNADSLGKVADGLDTLAETRKIKAETNQTFVRVAETLIAQQPIENQTELIKKSIDARVAIAKNTRQKGWLEMAFFIFFIFVIKYLVEQFFPRKKIVRYH